MTALIASLSSDHPPAFLPSENDPLGIHEMTTHLSERVERAIQQAPHLNRQHLRFETNEGRVVLKGTVGSYFHKQMAQEAVRNVDGVDAISNQLNVCWS